MPRTVAIDFGMKRCGIAISDPLGMIANGLETVETTHVMSKLEQLKSESGFDTLVVGKPTRMNGDDSLVEPNIKLFVEALEKKFQGVIVKRFDERFTSKIAAQTMISAGSTKSQRREKGTIDKISATLILQDYLNTQQG
jgi:putative Holliday junction resolvase